MIEKASRLRGRWQPARGATISLAPLSAESIGPDRVLNGEASRSDYGSVCAEASELKIDGGVLPQVSLGLAHLLESFNYALAVKADPWEFSMEWSELQRLGLTCNHVRWLISNGLVHHAREVTGVQDEKRRFVTASSLYLRGNTCFILTQQGHRLACQLTDLPRPGLAAGGEPLASCPSGSASLNGDASVELLTPKWDRDRRQLRLGTTVVKEFKLPAANQEIVLAVFEEEHWPPRIDDPLPRNPDIDRQRRLHDTINSLNRRQHRQLLHFGADGLAQGILWELVDGWDLEK